MKKTFNYFRTMAALLFAGAMIFSCTLNEEPFNEPDQPVVDGPKTYTLTVTAGNAATKALNVDGEGKLSATWGANDQIQVVKGSTSLGYLTVNNITDGGKTATFSGNLTKAVKPDDVLVLWYNNKGYNAFKDQDGTLASAAAHDCAKATVTVGSVDDQTGHVTLKNGKAVFETQTAVIKFTLSDGENPLNPSNFKLSALEQEIFTFDISSGISDGVLYFAVPDQNELAQKIATATGQTVTLVKFMLNSTPVTVTATCSGWVYSCVVTGYTFVKNTYYTANLTLSNIN